MVEKSHAISRFLSYPLTKKNSLTILGISGIPEPWATWVSVVSRKKKTLAHVFSCDFHEIFKNIFFYRTSPVVVSDMVFYSSLYSKKRSKC